MNRTQRRRALIACSLVAGLGMLTGGATSVAATAGGQLSLSLCDPASQSFTPIVMNTYSPFPPGASWHYSDGAGNKTDVTVLPTVPSRDTFTFSSGKIVHTVDVRESDTHIDGTSEMSDNWYAQTTTGAAGTVCYFGEQEHDFNNGVPVPPDPAAGSWLSTQPGFAPGIVMPATPQVGQKFQQEFAPGVAADEGEIVGIDATDVVNGRTFSNVIRMLEGDDLASGKGHTDTKLIAPGVGPIRDEALLLTSCSGARGC